MRTPLSLLLLAPLAVAAPVPADTEKPKPRAKLIATGHIDQRIDTAQWAADGKHLILRTEGETILLVRRDQLGDGEPMVKPAATLASPGSGYYLSQTADGSELYAVVPSRRFNAESRLVYWDVKRVLGTKEPAKPDRTVTLEPDSPSGGPLSADGKHLLVYTLEPRRGAQQNPFQGGGWGGSSQEYNARFTLLSTKTGDATAEVAVFDDPQQKYAGHTTDAKAGRLIVALHTAEETVVRYLNSTTGKQIWERKLADPPVRNEGGHVVTSPDGELVAVAQSILTTVPVAQPGRGGFGPGGGPGGGNNPFRQQQVSSTRTIPVLLTAKTGETAVELPTEDVQSTHLHGFSADGRLLAGTIGTKGNAAQVVVWDTKTGKPVKAWNARGHDLGLVFAPTGYELLVREVESKPIYGPTTAIPQGYGQGGQSWTTTREVVRTEYKTVLGVWDLSPLVK